MSTSWLPRNINLARLPGPGRRFAPEDTFRDEPVISPGGDYLALAYSIAEVGMAKEAGCILWARLEGEYARDIVVPRKVQAICWGSPWCRWVDERTFLFKIWHEFRGKVYGPLVAVHVDHGFQLIPETNNTNAWVNDARKPTGEWTKFSRRALLSQVRAAS